MKTDATKRVGQAWGPGRWAIVIATCASLSVAAGCNIIGPASYLIAGPEKVPAAFTLDPDRTTLIFIDDPGSQLPGREARLAMGKRAEEELLSRKLVPPGIHSASVVRREAGTPRVVTRSVSVSPSDCAVSSS